MIYLSMNVRKRGHVTWPQAAAGEQEEQRGAEVEQALISRL